MNKTEALEISLLEHDPHIAVITETWLRTEIGDEDVFPICYQVFRRDRPFRGGGVAVLIKDHIQAVTLEEIPGLECLCIKISCWGHSFILIAIYRPPDASVDYLFKLEEHMSRFQRSKLLLIGDLNLAGVNWERFESLPQNSNNLNSILNMMLTHNLSQIVQEPTRVQGYSKSVLDLVFVPRELPEYTVEVAEGISDHLLVNVCLCIGACTQSDNPVKFRSFKDYSRADDASIIEHLETCFIDFNDDDLNTLWDRFKDMCNFCIDKFVPSKRKLIRRQTPWMTREIIHLKRKIKRLKKRRLHIGNLNDLKESLARAVHTSKENYFHTVLPNFIVEEPKKFWNYISEKKKPVAQILVDRSVITDHRDIAHHFNDYFHSVFSNSGACPSNDAVFHPRDVSFISYPGVVSMLLNLKTKSSCGPDNLSNVFLKRYAESVAKFLVIIFRISLLHGHLPSDWRVARVVPVYKKGDRALLQNYRPISLTSSCCKLIEHIIANQINEFLDAHDVLSEFQHGFRKGYSTITQLVTVTHSLASCLDKNGQIDAIFLDFSKAFDRVPHDKLIFKLRNIGLPEILIIWITSYLTNRYQFVEVNGEQSGCLPVDSGVPQGSVLGPLLFLLYINDITTDLDQNVQIRLFADDCVLFQEITSINDQIHLNSSLAKIYEWCNTWDMKVNTDKTVVLRFARRKAPLSYIYRLGSSPLLEEAKYKYLGVTLTNTLSWNLHIDNICSSALRKLYFLRHKLKNSPSSVKLLAYNSLIRPKLEYACIVWDPFTKHNITRLEKVQRKAVRFIYSKFSPYDSPSELMQVNGIECLQQRRKNLRLQFLSALWNRELAINPSPYLSLLSSRHTRHHHPNSLTPFFARTDLFKFAFFPRTITDWNNSLLPFSTH